MIGSMKSGDKECVVGGVICPARTGESSAEGAERRSGDTNQVSVSAINDLVMKAKIRIIILAMLIALPVLSFGQYFQKLYDIDSSHEWGWNIFQKADSNYFIAGWSFNQSNQEYSLFEVGVDNSGDVSSVNVQNPLAPSVSITNGSPGQAKKVGMNGEYIVPFTIQWPNVRTHFVNSSTGVAKFNDNGDIIFSKTYTDTAIFFDETFACEILDNNGGYLLGGLRVYDTSSNYYVCYLIKTDTLGDTVWTHVYQKDTEQRAYIQNIISLPDGRTVVGAVSSYTTSLGYYHNTPWYLVLDSMGNLIKDTVFTSGYLVGAEEVCNELYADKNGGYINIGQLDTLYGGDPSDSRSFPGYIAHLDTNFRITWITSFPFNDVDESRGIATMRQLKDSSYLVIGDSYGNGAYDKGFAAKISRNGSIVWSHNYYSDPIGDAYLRDGIERPDGGFILTGEAANDTLPAWHQFDDMWLVGVDSNGCEDGLCAPAAVPAAPQPVVKENELLVYPNPTSSMLNFEFPASGDVIIKLMDITGRVLDEQQVANSATAAFSVRNYTPGLYLYQFITANTTRSGKFIVQ